MPRPVDMVPDPWAPYKDGKIWEFTEEEIRELPDYRPIANGQGELVGARQVRWYQNGKTYVRFFAPEEIEGRPGDWPEYLAGWVD